MSAPNVPWQYKHFVAKTGRGMVGAVYGTDNPNMAEVLGKYGEEGWELVAVHPVTPMSDMYNTAFVYVLKREQPFGEPPKPPTYEWEGGA